MSRQATPTTRVNAAIVALVSPAVNSASASSRWESRSPSSPPRSRKAAAEAPARAGVRTASTGSSPRTPAEGVGEPDRADAAGAVDAVDAEYAVDTVYEVVAAAARCLRYAAYSGAAAVAISSLATSAWARSRWMSASPVAPLRRRASRISAVHSAWCSARSKSGLSSACKPGGAVMSALPR
ncbi:hypothetical protein [Streptomyces sp. NPDC059455]|uniref:hypothetical protein n=1 Tax=Streptomyces sp. NPDC059455 TaxID=3346837 RepID=UPI00368A1220